VSVIAFESRYREDGHMISTSQPTRNDLPQVLNNFSIEKLMFLARLELGLLAFKDWAHYRLRRPKFVEEELF
jgi:hypothetical protein